MQLVARIIVAFIIWRRVFYWELNHSQIPYATLSGTRVAYFSYVTFRVSYRSMTSRFPPFSFVNNIHPIIKFTSNHSLTNVPYLDVMVSLHNGTIETDLHTKPTDKHQHLLSSSCLPRHTKKAIPFSLALRLRRICSTDAKFALRLKVSMK